MTKSFSVVGRTSNYFRADEYVMFAVGNDSVFHFLRDGMPVATIVFEPGLTIRVEEDWESS